MQPDLASAIAQYHNSGQAAAVKGAVSTLGPYATTYSAPSESPNQVVKQTTTPQGSNLSQFGHFLGGLFQETGHIAEGAAKWLGTNLVNMAAAPLKLGTGLGHAIVDNANLDALNKQNTEMSGKLQSLHIQYKSGQITKQQYQSGLKGLTQDSNNILKQQKGLDDKINLDQKASTKALIDTAGTIVTVLTAGFGGAAAAAIKAGEAGITVEPLMAKSASEWLASKATQPLFHSVTATIQHLASQPEIFKALDSTTQHLLQSATAEVVANAGSTMTAGQIARAAAVNIALKYPLFYNYTSGVGQEVYHELDQAKYGDAIRTLAFNALLTLSGGPIGHAVGAAKKSGIFVTEKMFGKTAFWDELGRLTGDPGGFVQAIAKAANSITDVAERKAFIRDLATVEAINTNAMKGNAEAAAMRIVKGMKTAYDIDMTKENPASVIENMVNLAKNFRIAADTAKSLDLGPIAVGRFDTRLKSKIAEAITQDNDPTMRMKAWEDLKATNANDALANNANLDKQIKQAIKTTDNSAELRDKIMAIKAQTSVKGFPEVIAKKMAKDGYIPIQPSHLEAPFVEGGDKLATAHGAGEDFFLKAVQPLPVLKSIGTLFTMAGLSPMASQQRAYEYLNDYLAKNLQEVGAINKLPDEDIHQASDRLIKQLSNYAKERRMPVPDLRMLTVKQIKEALGPLTTRREAKDIQTAIAKSHAQVPLAVRGMGDKAVDWTYRLPATAPVARQYLKVQGALRFAYNPFFRYLRLIPKTEILTEAEGGGVINSIFTGRLGEIGDIRKGLRESGFFDEVGNFGNLMSGEAVDATGTIGKNLTKHLVPMQERSVSGLIDAQAQRMGMDWREYIQQYPQNARDTIQMIAEYDKRSNFLNSPMARTMNVAIFPFRFETKVATIMARNLAKSSLVTQVGFINGLMHAHDFLSSDQGKAWYAQNADAIGVFKYITPFVSMEEAMSSLLPGHDHSLGNFGELGGLPFGWLPQILDSEGITNFNQAAMDAKTGQMIPDYVPKTSRGQAAIAIQDLLGMLFGYPGKMIGLPSKTSLTRNVADGLTGAKTSTDFTKVVPGMSSTQADYAQSIRGMNNTVQRAQSVGAAKQTGPTNVPSTGSSTASPRPKKASSAKPKSKKKSEYTPSLLPGQSNLGQL